MTCKEFLPLEEAITLLHDTEQRVHRVHVSRAELRERLAAHGRTVKTGWSEALNAEREMIYEAWPTFRPQPAEALTGQREA